MTSLSIPRPETSDELNRLFLGDLCHRLRGDELIAFSHDPNDRLGFLLAAARHEAPRLLANKKRGSRSTWLPQHVIQRELFKRRRAVTL